MRGTKSSAGFIARIACGVFPLESLPIQLNELSSTTAANGYDFNVCQ